MQSVATLLLTLSNFLKIVRNIQLANAYSQSLEKKQRNGPLAMTETKDDFSKSPSRVGKSLENHLLDTNPFLANALNLYPLKTQENQRFSRVFRGV